MSVDAVLFHRNTKHLGSESTVDVFSIGKNLLPPFLSGKPRNYTGFNSRKVRHNQLSVTLGDECSAD